jgi:hypothetical protein
MYDWYVLHPKKYQRAELPVVMVSSCRTVLLVVGMPGVGTGARCTVWVIGVAIQLRGRGVV